MNKRTRIRRFKSRSFIDMIYTTDSILMVIFFFILLIIVLNYE
jgi:hypothetical protein